MAFLTDLATHIKTWVNNKLSNSKTTSAMSGTTLVVSDASVTATSGIVWVASASPNGFIEVSVSSGQITFTSTVSETISFTYYVVN